MTITRLIDKDKLTAFERWELPQMGTPKKAPPPKEPEPEPLPPQVEEVSEEEVLPHPIITAEEIAAITEQAYQEGFQAGQHDGFEAGHQEGLASGTAEVVAKVQRLQQIIDTLAAPLAVVDDQVEQELLALVQAIGHQLIRRELQTSPDEIVHVVREAMAVLPSSASNIKVQLHPEDAKLVRELLPGNDEERPWRVIEDPVISRGGCQVVTDRSRVDATLEKRLHAVAAKLFGGERGSDESAG